MRALHWIVSGAVIVGCGSSGGIKPDGTSSVGRCIEQIAVGTKPCALRGDHTVWCGNPLVAVDKWGAEAAEISRDAACIRKLDGSVWCDIGGVTPTVTVAAPAPILSDRVIQFEGTSPGGGYCAVKGDHTLWCWGSSNSYGVMPPGAGPMTAAQHTTLGTRVASVGMGSYDHVCALSTDGIIYCWGSNDYGQVGNGTNGPTPLMTPVAISGVVMPTEVTTYTQESCAIGQGGTAYCWGTNYKGGIGDGTMIDRYVPTKVVGLPRPASKVVPGYGATYGVLDDGAVWAWGSSLDGQLGDGSTLDRPSPAPVPGITRALDVATDNRLTCAHDGASIWCWGRTLTPVPQTLALACP